MKTEEALFSAATARWSLEAVPLAFIVTAAFNAVEQLLHTLRSLREQMCFDFEWLVVDGSSKG